MRGCAGNVGEKSPGRHHRKRRKDIVLLKNVKNKEVMELCAGNVSEMRNGWKYTILRPLQKLAFAPLLGAGVL